jgi:hypothetical protein
MAAVGVSGVWLPLYAQTRRAPPRGEIPPAQAAVGRHMFHWVIQEPRTTRQMVKRLNALKIPTRTGQHPGWPVARVRWMLSNPL